MLEYICWKNINIYSNITQKILKSINIDIAKTSFKNIDIDSAKKILKNIDIDIDIC